MKSRGWKWFATMISVFLFFAVAVACGGNKPDPERLEFSDQDLSNANSAALEAAAEYKTRFKNGSINIGDVMPYYENGVYHFFYLAEGGGNAGHPVYLAETTDLVNFTDKGMVLAPGSATAQDSMIGTGSVVKVNNEYLFFYTGFLKDSPEKVMVAKSSKLSDFEKVSGFMLAGDSSLEGWDFRDPEAYFDGTEIHLFISAKKDGKPVVVRYTVSTDLQSISYKGVVFEDARLGANVLECPDVFKLNDKWYLTYSIQDVSNGGGDGAGAAQANVGINGKMYYAVANSAQGPYSIIAADNSLDSMAFYAAKTAQDENNTFLAGWVRQKGSNSGWQYTWGGNLQVHQLTANLDGTLNVSLPSSVHNYYSVERELDKSLSEYNGMDLIAENKTYHTVSSEYSSYLLRTVARFDSEVKEFGFALSVTPNTASIMELAFVPKSNKIRSGMNVRQEVASKNLQLIPDRDYYITLLVEGSAVTVYIDNSVAFTSRIRNIGNKKLAVYAKEGSVSFRDFHLYTPSQYADTLSAGSGLKVKSGNEITGNVKSVTAGPSAAEISYELKENNFIRYTVAAYAEEEVKATVTKAGSVIDEFTVKAGKVTQILGETYAAKGQKIVVSFTAAHQIETLINVSFETDKKPFALKRRASVESEDAPARFTAGESGVYAYTATLFFEGDNDALPIFCVGDNSEVKLNEGLKFVTVRGAVALKGGESLSASPEYKTVKKGNVKILLEVFDGSDVFASGVGTFIQPVAKSCIPVVEDVPQYTGDFTVDGDRGMNAEMNGGTFGVQGKNGFIYAYGRASDELLPMTEYNTNGELWEYKHKAPEASDSLEIKADYMKQGAGYVTAAVWIAPRDGSIGINADYTANGDACVQVQLLINKTRIYDELILPDGARTATAAIGSVTVKEGDSVAIAVRSAGIAATESDGNYHFSIFEGASVNTPKIADYKKDFNVKRQGDYGWHYARTPYSWSPEGPTGSIDLTLSDGAWLGGGSRIDPNGRIFGNETAIVWKNHTGSDMQVNFYGKITVAVPGDSSVAVRIWRIRADGGDKLKEGFFKNSFEFSLSGIMLKDGEKLAVIFFDNNSGGCDLELRAASLNQFVMDKTALDAAIAESKAIDNSDGRYTENSFNILKAAILTAENQYAELTTYEEISLAVQTLKNAVSELEVNNDAAKADLLVQILRAKSFDGLNLIGGRETLDAVLAEAEELYADESATAVKLAEATNALKASVDASFVKRADYTQDFSDKQGANGWQYLSATVSFAGGFNVAGTNTLTYDSEKDAYVSGDVLKIAKDGMRTHESAELFAAVGYLNYTASSHSYYFKGTAQYIGAEEKAVLAYIIVNADGTQKELKGDWNEFTPSSPLNIDQKISLGAGEMFLMLLRDIDKKDTLTKLTLEVGCNDTLSPDKSALSALIDSANALAAADYTDESFVKVTAALVTAQETLDNANADALAIQSAKNDLQAAINGLIRSNASAISALTQAVVTYGALTSENFTADTFADLTDALTEAQAVLDKGSAATTLELNNALNNLNFAAAALKKVIADYVKDFTQTQGNNGWYFLKTQYVFDGIDKPKTPELLNYNADELTFKDAGNSVNIGKDLIWGAMAEVAWENNTGKTQTFTFSGNVEKLGDGEAAALNFYTIHKSTPEEHLTAGSGDATTLNGWFSFNKAEGAKAFSFTAELKAGERFVIVLRDDGGAATNCKISMQVLAKYLTA